MRSEPFLVASHIFILELVSVRCCPRAILEAGVERARSGASDYRVFLLASVGTFWPKIMMITPSLAFQCFCICIYINFVMKGRKESPNMCFPALEFFKINIRDDCYTGVSGSGDLELLFSLNTLWF